MQTSETLTDTVEDEDVEKAAMVISNLMGRELDDEEVMRVRSLIERKLAERQEKAPRKPAGQAGSGSEDAWR